MSDVYIECPTCYGWGVEPELLSQWEEDEEPLTQCDYCSGLGYIPLEDGGEEIVVLSRDNSRSNVTICCARTCRCNCGGSG